MSLSSLAAFFVFAVLLHNGEEARWLPAWSGRAGRWHRPVGARPFRFAVALLSALLVALALGAAVAGPGSVAAYLFFGYVFAMAANAVAPHLVASLATRSYMPGTATGLLLNLPLGSWLLMRAVDEAWVLRARLVWVAPTVALGLLALIPLLFRVGERLFPKS